MYGMVYTSHFIVFSESFAFKNFYGINYFHGCFESYANGK